MIPRLLSFFALVLLALMPLAGAAQSRAFDCLQGKSLSKAEGQAILDRVQKTYAGIDALHGEFEQDSYLAALETGESSSGEMWFAKPGKMRWVYKAPHEQVVVISEGTLWLYQVDKRQVLVDDIGEVLLSDLPVSFMMGLGNLSRDFDFTGACKSPDGVVVSLVPKTSNKPEAGGRDELQGFDLLVDEGQSLPKGAKVESVGGNITAIVFRNLSTKIGSPDPGRFVLNYPKGVDVMDRRPARAAGR